MCYIVTPLSVSFDLCTLLEFWTIIGTVLQISVDSQNVSTESSGLLYEKEAAWCRLFILNHTPS